VSWATSLRSPQCRTHVWFYLSSFRPSPVQTRRYPAPASERSASRQHPRHWPRTWTATRSHRDSTGATPPADRHRRIPAVPSTAARGRRQDRNVMSLKVGADWRRRIRGLAAGRHPRATPKTRSGHASACAPGRQVLHQGTTLASRQYSRVPLSESGPPACSRMGYGAGPLTDLPHGVLAGRRAVAVRRVLKRPSRHVVELRCAGRGTAPASARLAARC